MIIAYTGNGKGKTTAALGLALRNLGHGKKVTVIHFMKKSESGEAKFKHEGYKNYQYGTGKFIVNEPSDEDIKNAKEGIKSAKEHIADSDVLILDELNVALHYKLLNLSEVLEFLKRIPKEKIVVITGRYAPKEIIEISDIATEMKEIKHDFKKGAPARRGVEF